MKRVLIGLAVMVFAAGLTWGNDLVGVYKDSIAAADTADVRTDTIYTDTMDIRGVRRMAFYSKLVPWSEYQADDTNWVDDSFFVKFQTSANLIHWNTYEVDTLLAADSGWSWLILNPDTSVVGNYGRGMLIHWDSIGVGEADTGAAGHVGNEYYKKLELWVCPKQ